MVHSTNIDLISVTYFEASSEVYLNFWRSLFTTLDKASFDLIVDDHFGKKNPYFYARGLAPSPKLLTEVKRINSFGGQIF